MLHSVGELPAVVYWRRRALLIGLLLAVVVGGGWVGVSAVAGGGGTTPVAAGPSSSDEPVAAPSLEQVVPSLAAVETPTTPSETPEPTPEAVPAPPPTPDAPVFTEGQACSDAMVAVTVVPEPAQAPVGSKPTFTLVVTNTSPVSCTRTLDAGLREVVLVDGAGTRLWGSNDCFPETSSDTRTLAAGQAVSFPVLWGGLTSNPGCTAARVNPAAGSYQVQGRVDTAVGAPTPFTLV